VEQKERRGVDKGGGAHRVNRGGDGDQFGGPEEHAYCQMTEKGGGGMWQFYTKRNLGKEESLTKSGILGWARGG